ncbi:MAG: hypothetical protein Q7V57_17785 [Actinomycetota bacterium]|nr:hypothetical protein [Actinomycetota bacterium]
MRRLTTTLGLLGTLAAVGTLSSCSTFDRNDVAAEVNGTSLTFDVLDDLAGGSTDAGVIRSALNNWVQLTAASDGTAVIVSPDDIDTQRQAIIEGLLAEHGGEGEKNYELGLDGADFFCLAAIPLADETDPDAVIQEIADGLSIADAAEQYSSVQSLAAAGGVVADDQGTECFDPDTFSQYFADIVTALVETEAKVGTPVSVDDGGGHQILLVLRPFDELSSDNQLLIEQAALAPVLYDLFVTADVWVNGRFGTWNAETAEILPPGQG